MCRPVVRTKANPYNLSNLIGSRFTRPIQTQLLTIVVPIVERRVVRQQKVRNSETGISNLISCLNRMRQAPVPKKRAFLPHLFSCRRKDGAAGGRTGRRNPPGIGRPKAAPELLPGPHSVSKKSFFHTGAGAPKAPQLVKPSATLGQ